MTLKLLLVATVLIALALSGIAIKMLLVKGGEFNKSCSSIDPATGKRGECTCGGSEDSVCETN